MVFSVNINHILSWGRSHHNSYLQLLEQEPKWTEGLAWGIYLAIRNLWLLHVECSFFNSTNKSKLRSLVFRQSISWLNHAQPETVFLRMCLNLSFRSFPRQLEEKYYVTHQNSPSSSNVSPIFFLSASDILFHSSDLKEINNIIKCLKVSAPYLDIYNTLTQEFTYFYWYDMLTQRVRDKLKTPWLEGKQYIFLWKS